MKSSKRLILELRRLNQKLDTINNNSRYYVYHANPLKFAFYNFSAGIFHSLGTLVGTAIIVGILAYFSSKVNLNQIITNYLQKTINQIQPEKILPTPSTEQPFR